MILHSSEKMEQLPYTPIFYVFVGPTANGREGGKVQNTDNIVLTEIWPGPSKKHTKLRGKKTQNTNERKVGD
jgi:hypothetical protein